MEELAISTSSDYFFHLIHRDAGIGCWSVCLQNNQAWLSDGCHDLLGLAGKQIPPLDFILDEMVHPDDRHIIIRAVKRFLHRRSGSYKAETRLRNSEGIYHWFEISADIQRNCENGENCLYGILTNIDERKLHEEESNKLKLMADVVDDMMGVGVMEINFATNARYISKAIYDILELPYDTPVSVITREHFCDPKDVKRYQTSLSKLQDEKRPFDTDIRLITAKGNTCWVRVTGKPVCNAKGAVVAMRSTIQKIEKEKLKENFLIEIRDRIKEQKFFLDETSTMSKVGGWEYDLENQTLYWTEQTKMIHGVATNYTPSLDKAFQFYTKDSYDLLAKHYNNLMENGQSYDLELELTTAKSEPVWIRVIGKPVYHLGKIIKVRGVAQDITKQKVREIELNMALNIINEQNDKLRDFTHIVSHNLRSHIGNLRMITEMIDIETDIDVKLEWIGLVKNVSNSLGETVNNLNGLVSLNVEQRKRLSFTETFRSVEKGINYKIINDEVDLRTDFSACDCVDYVPAYLESIMLNLVTNAIKYRYPGRKTIIYLRTELRDNKPLLEVRDNGLGIDLKQYGSRLFKMNQTFHRNSDARGIGLYITKNQVENMGGFIEVESTVDEGTTFTVHF